MRPLSKGGSVLDLNKEKNRVYSPQSHLILQSLSKNISMGPGDSIFNSGKKSAFKKN
jgi:hypothetical protein